MQVSAYIIAALFGWFVAHLVKFAIQSMRKRQFVSLGIFFESGGMPSSHTATVIALLVVIGARDGVSSGLFGLAALFAGIVMFDAIKVRRSAGEQGEAIKEIIAHSRLEVKTPRIAKGHTPLEVLIGALIGALVGTVVFIATK